MTISAKINPQYRIIVNKMDYGDRGLRNLTGSSILELQDVSNTAPTHQQYLRYNANTARWEPQTLDLSTYVESANVSAATDQAVVRYSVVDNTVQLDTSGVTIDDSGNITSSSGNITVSGNIKTNNGSLWGALGNIALGASADTWLVRDAANILAQRNGTNAQEFRIYNTYTDASNYERLGIRWDTNEIILGPENAGTGSLRELIIDPIASQSNTFYKFGQYYLIIGSYAGAPAIRVNNPTVSQPAYGFGSDLDTGMYLAGTNQIGFSLGGSAGLILSGDQSGTDGNSALDISSTWNTTGAPTLIKANVTDTASDAASSLLDLQVDGTSVNWTDKSGHLHLNNNLTAQYVYGNNSSSNYLRLGNDVGLRNDSTQRNIFLSTHSSGGVHVVGSVPFGWAPATSSTKSQMTLTLYPDADDILALRRDTNAQTFNIYNTYTDASNYERLGIIAENNTYRIASESSGTGSNREIWLEPNSKVAIIPQGGGSQIYLTPGTGTISTNSNMNISNGVNSVINMTAAGTGLTSILTGFNLATTFNNVSNTMTGLKLNVTDAASAAASLLMDLQVDGVGKVFARKDGLLGAEQIVFDASTNITYPVAAAMASSGILRFTRANSSAYNFTTLNTIADIAFDGLEYYIKIHGSGTNGSFRWLSDTRLYEDAAHILAQRNSTNAQEFRVYNTYTDSANNEYLSIGWSANTAFIETIANGAGTNRDLALRSATTYINLDENGLKWNTSGKGIGMGTNPVGAYNTIASGGAIGLWHASGDGIFIREVSGFSNGPRLVLSTSGNAVLAELTAITTDKLELLGATDGAAFALTEMSSAPAATGNTAIIFCEDNGSGKTRLMVQFGTGAAQQIAIEP